MRLAFVVPGDVEAPTGGNVYDLRVAAALRDTGVTVELRRAPGAWPEASEGDRARLARLLVADVPVVVDGLVACGAPDAVRRAVAAGSVVHVLVHLPLGLGCPEDPARAARLDRLEGEALAAARGVVVPSAWAAQEVRRRHGPMRVAVARPGVDAAPLAPGSDPPRLLQLAAVTPLKDQLGVARALARVADLPWTARLTGSLAADPSYAGRVRAEVAALGLADRVRLTGPLAGAELERAWAAADLLLLPSRVETWGLVVSEALARGVPVVVGAGTGAQEALGLVGGRPPGAVVEPGDTDALAAALRHLLGGGLAEAKRLARARRPAQRSWGHTAADLLAALGADTGT